MNWLSETLESIPKTWQYLLIVIVVSILAFILARVIRFFLKQISQKIF